MGKNILKRLLALFVAVTVIVAEFPGLEVKAGENKCDLLVYFDFDKDAVNDIFENDMAKAKLSGSYELEPKTLNDDYALYFNGKDTYLNVTKKDGSAVLAGKDNVSISYDVKPANSSKSWTFFAAPDTGRQTYLTEHYFGVLHTTTGLTVERYNNEGERPNNNLQASVSNEWTHVDILISETDTKLYVNGVKISESLSEYKLSDILKTGGILQIGKANWDSGEYFGGLIDNFKIYDGILTSDEINAQYDEFEEGMEAIKEGEKGLDFLREYEKLTIAGQDDIRNDIGLIKKTKSGATVEWTSSNPAVITDSDDNDESIYDGGIVTRPEAGSEPVKVKLTAKLTSADETMTKIKEFDVIVQPKTANLDKDYTAGYFWPHFDAAGGYEKIFFGYSEDGLKWKKLNKINGTVQPVLKNDAKDSDLGVRDPHLIRSADGDKYWLIGTDLHAEGGGAGGSGWNQLSASQNIVVWESNDLVNWSEPRIVYSGFDNAGCVWAPEAYYDKVNKDYVVYWSIRDNSKAGTNDNALRVYVCRTRDFNSFTESKIWLSEDPATSTEINIIDTSIVEDNGKFYRFSTSDWNTIIDVSDTLDTEDIFDVRVSEEYSKPNNSWKRIVKRSESQSVGFGADGIEGLTVYKLPDGRWCAMGDNSGYKAFVTDNLASGKYEAVKAEFVDGRFRHGSVIRLSKAEEKALLEAYKDKVEIPDISDDDGTEGTEKPILEYNFDNDLNSKNMTDTGEGDNISNNGFLYGNANIAYDKEVGSNVLKMDGSVNSYAEMPQGFFDGRNIMSISFDVKSEMSDGNFFTFTFGKNNTSYNFLRIRGNEVRNAITNNSWGSEQEVKASGAVTGTWQNVVLVFNEYKMKLYVDGTLVSENTDTGIKVSDLGTNLLSYLGKSLYDGDAYFKGAFDNIKVYDRALSSKEILNNVLDNVNLLKKVTVGTIPSNPSSTMGTDSHTAITSVIDKKTKVITSYVRKGTVLNNVPVTFDFIAGGVDIKINGKSFENGKALDLSNDVSVVLSREGTNETYILKKPVIAGNPVLPGQYADPDIDYFDNKYWIYPTTDGYSGWGGTVFHAWSSDDMQNWTDEGIILDVANDNPGLNEKNVRIASSEWSDGNAWAPSIEEKDGKYYFYYCGNIKSKYSSEYGSGKAIGVAWSDNPAGPFEANDAPIVYPKMLENSGIGFSGQVIDPSIFTDDNGKSYIFLGNGGNGMCVATLNDDMLSVKTDTIRKINGMKDFRESVVVTKRNGLYHFTWSCDDTGSPNYHVNYGTTETLEGDTIEVTYHYTLLQKDESLDILGTAHQSILYLPETDKCYIAYHRFYTPLGIYTDGFGFHRETCIDEVTFDENGLMKQVKPTMEGIKKYTGPGSEQTPTATPVPTATPTPTATQVPTATPTPTATPIPTLTPAPTTAPISTLMPTPQAEPTKVPDSNVVKSFETPLPVLKEKDVNIQFDVLFAQAKTVTNNSIKLKWSKVKSADGYIIYSNMCDSKSNNSSFRLVKMIDKNNITSYTHKKLKKGTFYKYIVLAYKMNDSKIDVLSASKPIYVTTAGGKYANIKKIKVNKTKIKLKKGKKITLKVTQKYKGKTKIYRKTSFASSNKMIATVNAKGRITAKKKGKCTIYIYAQNGLFKKVIVTVK